MILKGIWLRFIYIRRMLCTGSATNGHFLHVCQPIEVEKSTNKRSKTKEQRSKTWSMILWTKCSFVSSELHVLHDTSVWVEYVISSALVSKGIHSFINAICLYLLKPLISKRSLSFQKSQTINTVGWYLTLKKTKIYTLFCFFNCKEIKRYIKEECQILT